VISLEPGEEIIRVTRPHTASFISSIYFWMGILLLFIGLSRRLSLNFRFFSLILMLTGILLIIFSYIRRVAGYRFYLTNRRIISDYRFLRKLHREVSYNEIIDIVPEKGFFAKVLGYSDIWLYGYRKEWIVGRMRGVRFGDCQIITNKAWKNKRK
jgi:hypothetical protein